MKEHLFGVKPSWKNKWSERTVYKFDIFSVHYSGVFDLQKVHNLLSEVVWKFKNKTKKGYGQIGSKIFQNTENNTPERLQAITNTVDKLIQLKSRNLQKMSPQNSYTKVSCQK